MHFRRDNNIYFNLLVMIFMSFNSRTVSYWGVKPDLECKITFTVPQGSILGLNAKESHFISNFSDPIWLSKIDRLTVLTDGEFSAMEPSLEV